MAQNNAKGQNVFPVMGGDATGVSNKATVVALQGVSVSSTTPSNGQILTYSSSGTQWQASNLISTSIINPVTTTNSSTYNVTTTDVAIIAGFPVNGTSLITINLPATTTAGRIIFINPILNCTSLKLQSAGSGTINGHASVTYTVGIEYIICIDGTNWMVPGVAL